MDELCSLRRTSEKVFRVFELVVLVWCLMLSGSSSLISLFSSFQAFSIFVRLSGGGGATAG